MNNLIMLLLCALAQIGPAIGEEKKIIKTGQDRPTPAYLLEHACRDAAIAVRRGRAVAGAAR